MSPRVRAYRSFFRAASWPPLGRPPSMDAPEEPAGLDGALGVPQPAAAEEPQASAPRALPPLELGRAADPEAEVVSEGPPDAGGPGEPSAWTGHDWPEAQLPELRSEAGQTLRVYIGSWNLHGQKASGVCPPPPSTAVSCCLVYFQLLGAVLSTSKWSSTGSPILVSASLSLFSAQAWVDEPHPFATLIGAFLLLDRSCPPPNFEELCLVLELALEARLGTSLPRT
ncbi:unnamed protein product [Prorocentrum cordatum]|uniref:Inositol-polyphosphate 5-phosphatase n=1 Tax=Prorocentrum cordatum TaxID=2364126 RepID=A0ABN9SEC8_9DINO|nr:unnamed protein product [Polarella glacialis]